MAMQVETFRETNKERDPLHTDMEPTLESVLTIPIPFSFHIIGTFPDQEGRYQQLHVGAGVETQEQLEGFHRKMRTWPVPWEHTVIFWTHMPSDIPDISGRLDEIEIAETVIQHYLETEREYQEDMDPKVQLQDAIDAGMLNAEDIHQLLRNAVNAAREGYQRKPF